MACKPQALSRLSFFKKSTRLKIIFHVIIAALKRLARREALWACAYSTHGGRRGYGSRGLP